MRGTLPSLRLGILAAFAVSSATAVAADDADSARTGDSSSFAALLGELARAPERRLESSVVPDLPAGRSVGRYRVLGLLGKGAMGAVYRAHDEVLAREVALKLLFAAPGDATVDRFRREVVALAAVSHPNVIAVFDAGVDADTGQPYVVLELVEGQTLRERLRKGALPVVDAFELARELARGLEAAHGAGIVHRDLKPENVLVDLRGTAKIGDFGLARLALRDESGSIGATESGVLLGTAQYMAPEQVRGEKVDARADLFAFGAVLFEALTGRRAFEAPSRAEVITAILRDRPASDPALLAEEGARRLFSIAFRCLEKDASQRFESASALLTALEAQDTEPAGPAVWATAIQSADEYVAPPDVPPTRYATSAGVHLAYQVASPAGRPTLVAAAPLTSNIEVMWEHPGLRRMMKLLGSFSHLIHYDRRGVGMSDPIGPEATLDERVEDLRAVFDAEGIERAFVVGASEGGPISVAFAVRYPERTRGLLLMNSFARCLRAPDYDIGTEPAAFEALSDAWAKSWGTLQTMSVPLFVQSRIGDPVLTRWAARYDRQCNSPGTLRRLLRMIAALDVRTLLPQVRCPVLLIHRREEPLVPVRFGRYMAQQIAHARYEEIDGVDHCPWEGDIERWVALARNFVESVVEREASSAEVAV